MIDSDQLLDQIIVINNRFNRVNADNRMGLLPYDEYLRNISIISVSILSIIDDIQNNVELMAILRRDTKNSFFRTYISINVDYSEFVFGKKRNYSGTQFLDIDDFLNEIYFEIHEFVPPGSFRKNWIIKNVNTGQELSDREINSIIHETYHFMERMYSYSELQKIHNQSDRHLLVTKLDTK